VANIAEAKQKAAKWVKFPSPCGVNIVANWYYPNIKSGDKVRFRPLAG